MTNEDLLKQFGEYMGIRHLRLDINRSCQLRIADDFVLIINEIDEQNLLLSSVVGQITQENAEQSALILLSMSTLFAHVEGPYMTWEPEKRLLMLARPLQSVGLDAGALEDTINYLMQNTGHVRTALQEKGVALSLDNE